MSGPAAPLAATRAAWILPISSPPIRDGGLVTQAGRIVDLGPWPAVASRLAQREAAGHPVQRHDAGARVVLPALVNAHTHLELSWMRGRLGEFASMPEWVRALVGLRRRESADEQAASAQGIREALACGTGAIGDIGNTPASCAPLAGSPLRAVVFRELIGFDAADPEAIVARAADEARATSTANVRVALAAHAPYSVSPALFEAVGRRSCAEAAPVMSVHVAESPEEAQLLAEGTGPWRDLLEQVGAWTPAWTPPRCSPVRYLERLGWVTPGAVLVHAVHVSEPDLERVAAAGAAIVACPRSNARLRVGTPPLQAMLASGVTLALGTDSLASVDDLNVFAELAAARRLAPHAAASRWLACATIGGARALRLEDDLGSLDVGKQARAIAVAIDTEREDVEEQLLRGVEPRDIAWVPA